MFKSVINSTLKDFSSGVPSRRTEELHKNMVKKDLFAIIPTSFGNNFTFQLFPRVVSLMNGRAGDHGGLSSIGFRETKFELFRSMFKNKTDN